MPGVAAYIHICQYVLGIPRLPVVTFSFNSGLRASADRAPLRQRGVGTAREVPLGAMLNLASLAHGLIPGSWRLRARELYGLDGPVRDSRDIPIPYGIGAKNECDKELYRFAMRQETASSASSQYARKSRSFLFVD